LTRNTRKVELTEAGRAFLAECRVALAQIDHAVESARHAAVGDRGRLAVAYMDFAINGVLPDILACFRDRFPTVRVDLHYHWTEQQKVKLLEREIDVGFLIGPFASPQVDTLKVASERFVAVLPERHRLARRRTIAVADLADELFVFGAAAMWGPFRATVNNICLEAGFAPNVVQEAHNRDGIFGLVAAGMGITIYVECATRSYHQGLVIRPLTGVASRMETVAAWHKGNPSPIVPNFLSVVRDRVSAAR
jgi:DNA-binding transcriptional LysR family regulator